jgi:hypothetical protein
MGMGGKGHAPAVLPPGMTRYPFCKRLEGPQGRSGRVREVLLPQGFDPRTVQPVASRLNAVLFGVRPISLQCQVLGKEKVYENYCSGCPHLSQ